MSPERPTPPARGLSGRPALLIHLDGAVDVLADNLLQQRRLEALADLIAPALEKFRRENGRRP